jgi:triosephosphate isomerase
MRPPLVIVNLKAYEGAYGDSAIRLCLALEEAAGDLLDHVAVAAQPTDIRLLTRNVKIPVLAQHVDAVSPGSHTGTVLPEAAAAAGAIGTLINHSERRLLLADIASTVERCRDLGLISVVCAGDARTSAAAAALSPEYVAVEPPELIGGDISVSKARPEVISDTVKLVRSVNPEVTVLCGAGVKDSTDVRRAVELGAEGVLVASGVVKSPDPGAALADLLSGLGLR